VLQQQMQGKAIAATAQLIRPGPQQQALVYAVRADNMHAMHVQGICHAVSVCTVQAVYILVILVQICPPYVLDPTIS
jgi:hypothetical protein